MRMVNLGFNRISVWGKHTARVAEFVAAVAGPSNFNVIAPVPGILNNVREVGTLSSLMVRQKNISGAADWSRKWNHLCHQHVEKRSFAVRWWQCR